MCFNQSLEFNVLRGDADHNGLVHFADLLLPLLVIAMSATDKSATADCHALTDEIASASIKGELLALKLYRKWHSVVINLAHVKDSACSPGF